MPRAHGDLHREVLLRGANTEPFPSSGGSLRRPLASVREEREELMKA